MGRLREESISDENMSSEVWSTVLAILMVGARLVGGTRDASTCR